jgi:hypothetical protein
LHVAAAARKGFTPAIRFNGTSDVLPLELVEIMGEFPMVQFYDYTKNAKSAYRWAKGEYPENYHLTYSASENTSTQQAVRMLTHGINVAVVFSELPERWFFAEVVDGDETDARFLDPKGVVVGLTVKGKVKDKTGFVQVVDK